MTSTDRSHDPRYAAFPEHFFARQDESSDASFYDTPRMVTHIDDGAIEAAGALYTELGIEGQVLDLMSSWISHFVEPPQRLTALGMNAAELARNEHASGGVVADLNAHPLLPFPDASFDHVVCAVSVDYLARPLEVFDEVRRVLRPGGRFVNCFSNRLFPTKAILGWLQATEHQRVSICEEYYRRSNGWSEPLSLLVDPNHVGDPLYGVWADAI